ncbi:MAG: hypothetical protein JXQ27_04025 [Acidobacteria bacterium]|nr:hypothetical protein [Acidobacteriota bacterium]
MKKRHLLIVPLLFLTFLLFSTRKEEPPPIHGAVVIRSLHPDGRMPAIQMAIQTVQQESEGSVLVTPSPPITVASLFVQTDRQNGLDSGIALFNAAEEEALVQFRCTSAETGEIRDIEPVRIPPRHKYARVLSQWLIPQEWKRFEGQLIIEADRPIHVLGLLTSSDKIYHLPVIDTAPLPEIDRPSQWAFPHFAFGGGYRCTLMMWNPTDDLLSCEILFLTPEGEPADGLLGDGLDTPLQITLMPGQTRKIFLGAMEAQ